MSAKTSSSSSNQDLERSSERSYFEKRIYDEMGLTPEQNKITLSYECDDWRTVSCEKEIFSEDKYGNIKILLYDIYGSIIQYNDPNGPSSLNFSNRMVKRPLKKSRFYMNFWDLEDTNGLSAGMFRRKQSLK